MSSERLTRNFILLRALRWLPVGLILPFLILTPVARGLDLGGGGSGVRRPQRRADHPGGAERSARRHLRAQAGTARGGRPHRREPRDVRGGAERARVHGLRRGSRHRACPDLRGSRGLVRGLAARAGPGGVAGPRALARNGRRGARPGTGGAGGRRPGLARRPLRCGRRRTRRLRARSARGRRGRTCVPGGGGRPRARAAARGAPSGRRPQCRAANPHGVRHGPVRDRGVDHRPRDLRDRGGVRVRHERGRAPVAAPPGAGARRRRSPRLRIRRPRRGIDGRGGCRRRLEPAAARAAWGCGAATSLRWGSWRCPPHCWVRPLRRLGS